MAHALNKKATVMLFDTYATFNHILDEPLNYGIDDIYTYCSDW
jgi:phospholipase/lecithinase/hemolysin